MLQETKYLFHGTKVRRISACNQNLQNYQNQFVLTSINPCDKTNKVEMSSLVFYRTLTLTAARELCDVIFKIQIIKKIMKIIMIIII